MRDGAIAIGMPVRREEDFRLLRGKGRYVDDVRLPREARGYVVRSPHAHARIDCTPIVPPPRVCPDANYRAEFSAGDQI
jgi:hypothetical protein